jgi:hypothetical protein
MIGIRNLASLSAAIALVAGPSSLAYAGPPFVTDDPEPTDYGHFEIYLYSQGTQDGDTKTGTALGLDMNYGALPNLQISLSVPVDFSAPQRRRTVFAVSDVELGVKYRFVEESADGWRPQVSFYPSIDTSLGGSRANGGSGATHEFLPLWAQKSFGGWTTFGGGGLRINPGRDGVNSWFAGWGFLRRLTDRFQLGAEIFHETAEARMEKATAGVNVGAIYDLSDAFHFVASTGTDVEDRGAATWSYYAALEWTH